MSARTVLGANCLQQALHKERKIKHTVRFVSFSTALKGCSHDKIANPTTIFITTNGLYGIQRKCLHGATATTLNSLQLNSSEK